MKHGDRRYDDECAEHARGVLRRWVDEQGGQARAAEIFGVNQSTIARSLSPSNQPTLKILLLLRDKTGWTLERILGLPERNHAPATVRLSESELMRVAERVAEQVGRKMTPKPMPAVKVPPKKPTG